MSVTDIGQSFSFYFFFFKVITYSHRVNAEWEIIDEADFSGRLARARPMRRVIQIHAAFNKACREVTFSLAFSSRCAEPVFRPRVRLPFQPE